MKMNIEHFVTFERVNYLPSALDNDKYSPACILYTMDICFKDFPGINLCACSEVVAPLIAIYGEFVESPYDKQCKIVENWIKAGNIYPISKMNFKATENGVTPDELDELDKG